MSDHMDLHAYDTVTIHGEAVKVDKGIVDLVLWVNSLPGVKTYNSCQGDPEQCSDDAFVTFDCEISESLREICNFVAGYAAILPEGNDRYRLSFLPLENLVEFNKDKFSSNEVS